MLLHALAHNQDKFTTNKKYNQNLLHPTIL